VKTVDCASAMGNCPTNFKVSSGNDEELVHMVQAHAKGQYNMNLDRATVMKVAK
jgi:predicted small metal-binding protein